MLGRPRDGAPVAMGFVKKASKSDGDQSNELFKRNLDEPSIAIDPPATVKHLAIPLCQSRTDHGSQSKQAAHG